MKTNLQRAAYEAFVRSGASPVPPSEVEKPLADGTYRTSAANAGWVFWQAGQAAAQQQRAAPADAQSPAWSKATSLDGYTQCRFCGEHVRDNGAADLHMCGGD